MVSIVAALMVAGAIVGGSVRVVVIISVMMRMVIIVVVIPNVDSITIFVAPFNLCLEVRSLSMFVSLNSMIWVSSAVSKFPSVRVWNTGVPV